jgi:hypothetical protein
MDLACPKYRGSTRRTAKLLMERGGNDAAIFLGAMLNLARSPEVFLPQFLKEGVLKWDEFGRMVLVLGGSTSMFRGVFSYDQVGRLDVLQITHVDGRPVVERDFSPRVVA